MSAEHKPTCASRREPPLHETINGRRFIRGHLYECDISAHGFDGMKTPEPPCNLGCAELRHACDCGASSPEPVAKPARTMGKIS